MHILCTETQDAVFIGIITPMTYRILTWLSAAFFLVHVSYNVFGGSVTSEFVYVGGLILIALVLLAASQFMYRLTSPHATPTSKTLNILAGVAFALAILVGLYAQSITYIFWFLPLPFWPSYENLILTIHILLTIGYLWCFTLLIVGRRLERRA